MVATQARASHGVPNDGGRGRNAPRRGFLAGVLAALAMTGVMAAVRLTGGVVSLPEILGEAILSLLPPAVFSFLLSLLQRAAKPLLYAGIFVGQLVVGGYLGRWYTRGDRTWARALKLALVVWLVVGVVALPALGVGLFGSAVRAGPLVVGAHLLVAFLSFAVALVLLDRALAPTGRTREQARAGRRSALATLAGGVAVVAAGSYAWRTLVHGTGQPTATAPEAAADAAGAARTNVPETEVAAGDGAPGSASDAPAEVFDAVAGARPGGPTTAGSSAPGAASGLAPKRGVPPFDAPSVPMTVAPGIAANAPFDVPSLTPEVLSAKDFYTVSKNLLDPQVNASTWKLTVDGHVERPMTLSYDDLRALPTFSDYYTLQCIDNPVGGDLWGNAHWRGVRLIDLLTRAGLKPDVRKVVFHAEDDYTDSIVIDAALRPDTLLAYEMNGEPLTKEHGYPARLLVPGIYGMKNVKWITRIELVDYDFKGFWMQRGWSDPAPYQTASRIDVPRNRAMLPAGEVQIAGVAFAGARGIDKVEVSLDDGTTWRDAQLKPALAQNAWNLWLLRTTLDAGTYPLKVRATDGNGDVQTFRNSDPLPNGATGWHSVLLRVG